MGVVLEHKCPQRDRVVRSFGEKLGSHGPAFENEPEYDSQHKCWAVTNGEYASPVWFCPFCGAELLPNSMDNQSTCDHDFKGAHYGFALKNCAKCGAKNPSASST